MERICRLVLRFVSVLPLALVLPALIACEQIDSPKPTPVPTATYAPPTQPPLPTAIPTTPPLLGEGTSIVIGGELRKRGDPSTASEQVGTLPDGAPVRVAAVVKGENWLVGAQTWVSTAPEWTTDWYQLDDGTYIYSAFIFTLLPGESSPLRDPAGAEKWIDVNVSTQTATAMIGDQAVHIALATTGSPEFPSPLGRHDIEPDGRVSLVDMTASQAGYAPEQASYNVERVLFTQYIDRYGNAIHLNYWRPDEVYGNTATSHGCVGLSLHDAQYFWLFGEPGMRVEIHE